MSRKLEPNGTERWLETIEPDGYTVTTLTDVANGRDGQIVVVGSTNTADAKADPIIVSVEPRARQPTSVLPKRDPSQASIQRLDA